VAVVIDTETSSGVFTTETRYLLKDHLGSLDVTTDSLGNVLERLSFDASKRSLATPRRASAASPDGRPTAPAAGIPGRARPSRAASRFMSSSTRSASCT
jgi:hypothetical protein